MRYKAAILVILTLVAIGVVSYLEHTRKEALSKLAPFAEFSVWKRFGLHNLNTEPGSLFAYPTDIAFQKMPEHPLDIAVVLWKIPGLRSVKINVGEHKVPRELLVGVKTARIKALDLDGAKLGQDLLDELDGTDSIEMLILTGSDVNTFPKLSIPKLKELSIGISKLTDQGMKYIFDMSSLEILDISGATITEISVSDLKRLTKLSHLYIGDTGISQNNIDELIKAMPNLSVHH